MAFGDSKHFSKSVIKNIPDSQKGCTLEQALIGEDLDDDLDIDSHGGSESDIVINSYNSDSLKAAGNSQRIITSSWSSVSLIILFHCWKDYLL